MPEQTDSRVLRIILEAIVDHPEAIEIDRKVDEMGVLLSLKVHPEDMGQIIGKQGGTAQAIRTIVRIIGIKNHSRVNLKILEPEGSTRRKPVDTSVDLNL